MLYASVWHFLNINFYVFVNVLNEYLNHIRKTKKEAMNAQLYTKWDAINFTRIINNHTLMGDL